MLRWDKSTLLTLALCFAIAAASEGVQAMSSMNLAVSGPVQLGDNVSSTVSNHSVDVPIYCFFLCLTKGCSVLVMRPGGFCQLTVINDASTAAVPAQTLVPRLLGAEPGDQVWKAQDFEQQLKLRSYGSFTFRNSSTGRNGTIQSLTILLSGCYRLEVFGARGGTSWPTNTTSPTVSVGGNGASMLGLFNLTVGLRLAIVVGQRGGDASQADEKAGAGGGGGSFVYDSGQVGGQPLIAAGGGGGGTYMDVGVPGQNRTSGTDTIPCSCNQRYYGFGGSNGQPGFVNVANASAGYNFGGAGAGWLARAPDSRRSGDDADGGGSRAEAWLGGAAGSLNAGAAGGFGGGGGGGNAMGAGGGGGGFSGGGAGLASHQPGGGGCSYCSGSGCYGITGGNLEDSGKVFVRFLSKAPC